MLVQNPKARRKHLRTARNDDGGLAIYDEASDDGHLLNITAAIVYELADGTRSLDALTEQVAARTGLPADRDVVLAALEELDQAGLLQGDTFSRPNMHRRSFLAKLSLVAGAAALVPIVQTVNRVSQAATAASRGSAPDPSMTTTGQPDQSFATRLSVTTTGQPEQFIAARPSMTTTGPPEQFIS
jgi:hypothetical protein